MEFNFSTANEIHFGPGIARSLSDFIPGQTGRCFVLTGSSPERHREVINNLANKGKQAETASVVSEPTIETINSLVRQATLFNPEVVIGIGGGSVIDAGKAIAALVANPGDPLDYLEVVGKGLPLTHPAIPYMAIPTTAGTGSEVTCNSVIGVPVKGVKVSLRSPSMLPRWAVVDPELTYQLPHAIAAYTGMDALIQCFEAYLSRYANPITEGIALEGLRRAARSLRKACSDTINPEAKEDMCVASLCSGIALANSKLGAVHGFAGPIGGMIDAPHGALCASLLLPVIRMNVEVANRRDPDGTVSRKLDQVAKVLTGNTSANAHYAIAWIDSLIKDLPLKSLADLGFQSSQIPQAVEMSAKSSSMKGNPVDLELADLREILQDSLEIH